MAEQVLSSVRIGRVGREGHAVHLRLARHGLEVRLVHQAGRLHAEVLAERDALASAEHLSQCFAEELSTRGITLDGLEVRPTR